MAKKDEPNRFLLFFKGFLLYIALDFVWLGVIAGGFYQSQLNALLTDTVSIPLALVIYAVLIFGHFYFVLPKISKEGDAFTMGAVYGGVVYAVSNLSNLASIAGWPQAVSLLDIAWGMIVNGIVAWVLARSIEK